MGKPLWSLVLERPATSLISTAIGVIWLYIKQRQYSGTDLGMSYDKVVTGKEHWRLVISQISHIDFVHILFNFTTNWSLGALEPVVKHGSTYYLCTSLLFLCLSGLVLLGMHHVLIHQFHYEAYRHVTVVGYSAVLFGWMTLICIKHSGGLTHFSLLGMATVPMWAVPFLYLALMQAVAPNCSFTGHLAGIASGLLVASGAFTWLTPYWSLCLMTWVVIGTVYSMVKSGLIGLPYVRISSTDVEAGNYPAITIS